jgi:hypothetical protein
VGLKALRLRIFADLTDCDDSFLPDIYLDPGDRPVGDPTFGVLVDDPEVCKELTRNLFLDEMFLTKEAWDSNGFLMTRVSSDTAGIIIHSKYDCPSFASKQTNKLFQGYSARFLVKFLDAPNVQNIPKYKWLYLSFTIVWLRNGQGEVSCLLVCFDDCNKIRNQILDSFKGYLCENLKGSPFSIYDALLKAIIMQYDEALWLFRKPIRGIEKVYECLPQ